MAANIPLKTSTLHHRNPKLLIPILISSIKAPENPSSKSILKSCSTKLLHFLQTSSSSASFLETHLNTILALIPIMLFRREIVSTVAKIVGFLSLLSIEVNEMISDDKVILKRLVVKIVGCDDWVLKTRLVNVVLDVCVTFLGRRRLIEVSGLDYLMLGFLQVKKSMPSSNSIIIMEKEGDLCLGTELSQGKLPLLLFGAAVTLTNCCNIEQLKIISRNLIEALVPYWKEIWSNLHKQLLASKVMNHSKHKCCYLSNVTVYNLAESIFRLSAYCSGLACNRALQYDVIDHLFRAETSSFKNFLLEHWESSPFLKRRRLEDMKSDHDIFGTFMHSLTSEESMPKFIASLLQGMVSCPPVTLEDINGLHFLNDVRDTLGCPLIYQQDIRVVKTNLHSRIENQYFQESSSKGMEVSRPFSFNEILKCVVAYGEGYTVAIRGMEYRTESIALLTQLVANLFGQPSVGANLYVTPPNSQGLACHYDDHCVFVCQLRGSKRWNVFPKPVVQLPRLYEHLQVPQELLMDGRQILLEEGDVLYIPRGFAHEAHTISDSSESIDSSNFSVHLTLAIDVEPSFEWEGFAHVALHGWIYRKQDNDCASDIDGTLQAIYVNVLHVAIKLISHSEPVFRKACLVAANSFPQETNDWLDENQRFIFNQVINKVHELANFTDSIKFVKLALQRNEDPFQMFRWLHLNGKDIYDCNSVDSDLAEIRKIISTIDVDKANAEAAFGRLKSKFRDGVLFDDAKERFKNLHGVYKEGRVQFMNGMLSLHC